MKRISRRNVVQGVVLLTGVFFFCGCSHHELSVHGQSGVLSRDSLARVSIGDTTEKALIGVLGEPSYYYHDLETKGHKYCVYSTVATIRSNRHIPFVQNCRTTSHVSIMWFEVAEGVVTEVFETEEPGEFDIDFQRYLYSPDPELKTSRHRL